MFSILYLLYQYNYPKVFYFWLECVTHIHMINYMLKPLLQSSKHNDTIIHRYISVYILTSVCPIQSPFSPWSSTQCMWCVISWPASRLMKAMICVPYLYCHHGIGNMISELLCRVRTWYSSVFRMVCYVFMLYAIQPKFTVTMMDCF